LRTILASALVVLAFAGCVVGNDDPGETATSGAPPTSATTERTREREAKPLNPGEARWLRRLTAYKRRVDRKLVDLTYRTSGVMRAFASLLRDCRPAILKGGAPSERFLRPYLQGERACKRFRRAAGLFDAAALTLEASDTETGEQAVNAAFEALGRGRARLVAAKRRADKIRASVARS
jgi:hypothetical protein